MSWTPSARRKGQRQTEAVAVALLHVLGFPFTLATAAIQEVPLVLTSGLGMTVSAASTRQQLRSANPVLGEDTMRPARLLAGLVVAVALLASASVRARENWPMYGRNLLHTFSNARLGLTPGNGAKLN